MEFHMDLFWALAAFVLGAVIGSFLNVVIVRLPLGLSIVYPSSRCPVCLHEIRPYDNIPIVSFFFLRGRCRDCGTRISFRYPFIEFTSACLSFALYWKFGLTPAFIVFFACCSALLTVFWIDLDHMIIPDVISLNGIGVGAICAAAGWIPDLDWKFSLIGIFLGGGILYIPALIYEKVRGVEGLGGGDIKLLAMIGAFTGPQAVIFVLFCSSLVGTVTALLTIAIRGGGASSPIPFGPFLTTSAIAYIFAGKQVMNYFHVLSAYF
jgi:leader peptidase (prepilin peptidase) / N-methyltransferase